jgi:hypothetical protein
MQPGLHRQIPQFLIVHAPGPWTFLALPVRVNVFKQTSVYGCMFKMVKRIIKHQTIIGKNGDGNN